MNISLVDKSLVLNSARTCYSKDLVTPESRQVSDKVRDSILSSTLEASHLTTRQHKYYTFGISGVSRSLVWLFLHSHPFYNTEEKSLRYVDISSSIFHSKCKVGEEARTLYKDICKELFPIIEKRYKDIFPYRNTVNKYKTDVQHKVFENARAIIPNGILTNLYHTISHLTLLRYYALSRHFSDEAQDLVDQMVNLVQDKEFLYDLDLVKEQEESFSFNTHYIIRYLPSQIMAREFSSLLVDYPRGRITDYDIIRFNKNSRRSSLNLYDYSDSNIHTYYEFDSTTSIACAIQQQRYRGINRDIFTIEIPGDLSSKGASDFIYFPKIFKELSSPLKLRIGQFLLQFHSGLSSEEFIYNLPNCWKVSYTESGNLVSFLHKWSQRLCLNAQDEIWEISKSQWKQVKEVHNLTIDSFGAPCHIRQESNKKPFCPEGKRFCGIPVWKKDILQIERTL